MKKSLTPTLTKLLRCASGGLTGLLLLAGQPDASAANVTWTGNAGTFWTTPGNWTPGAPNPDDALIFGASSQLAPENNFPAGTTFSGLTFNATDSYTLTGNSIGLIGPVENSGSALQTLSLPLVITNAVSFNTVSNASLGTTGDFMSDGGISGSGSLVKLGGGVLTLTNKSYSGGSTVNAGLLVAQNDNGGYTMSGGSLLLDFGSFYSGPTIAFTADASVGTTARGYDRYDYAGQIGSPGFKWTVIGTGRFQVIRNAENGFLGSAIIVASGATLSDDKPVTGLGGANVPITVEDGGTFGKYNGWTVPNPVTLNGVGVGGQGALTANYQSYQDPATVTNVAVFTNTINLATDSTIGVHYGSLVLAGAVTGPGSLTKIGNGPLILKGTNSYVGSTTISTGAVQLASSKALPTTGNLQIIGTSVLDLNGFDAAISGLTDDSAGLAVVDNTSATPATLTVGSADGSVAFTGGVKSTSGALSLGKVGFGSASFTGANTFNGGITLQGGSLTLNIPTGTITNGPVTVANDCQLTLIKTVGGASIRASAATLGTSGATALSLDLGNFGSPSVPLLNVTNGSGVLSVGGAVTVNIQGNGNLMSVGQFPLIRYVTRTGSGSFALGSLPSLIEATIVTNAANKSIDLKITSAPMTKWYGNVNNLWDVGITANWRMLGAPVTYSDYTGVMFDDTALTNNVDLTTTLMPSAVLVNANSNYVFGGAGSLNSGDLSKSGNGKLTLATPNAYNNTTISAGTLEVGDGGPLGGLGYGTVQNDASLVFNTSEPASVGNPISGIGTVIKQNTNMLTLTSANTYSGGTVINQGRLQLGTASSLGTPAGATPLAIVASGAALDINGKLVTLTNATRAGGLGISTNQGVVFNGGGGTCVGCGDIGLNNIQLTANASIGNDVGDWVIGANGIGLAGNGFSLTKVGGNIIYIRANAASAFSSFNIGAGGILIECSNPFGTGTPLVMSNNASLDSWGNNSGFTAYTVANSILVTNGGARIMNTRGHWWNTPDSDTYTGTITLADNLTVQNSSVRSGIPGILTLSGPITGAGSVTKTGSQLVTLSGANTYTGPTTISAGTLAIDTRAQGGGAYTNLDGGTLSVALAGSLNTIPMSSFTVGSSTGAVLSFQRMTALPTNAPITATNLNVIGVNAVALPTSAMLLTSGQFPLIKYSGTVNGGGSFSLGGRGIGGFISNNVANSTIDYVATPASPVTWAGNSGNIWDIATTANWNYLATPTTFQTGDAILLDDSALTTTVNVSVAVSPSLIVVSNATKTYSLTNQAITGSAALVKVGAGAITVANTNTYSGGTLVSDGTVKLGSDGALNNTAGTAIVTNSGAIDFNNYNPAALTCTISGAGFQGKGTLVANYTNAATAKGPKTVTLAGNATIGGSNRWDLRATGAALISPTNAYTLTKVGANLIGMVATTVSPTLGDIYVLGGLLGFQTSTSGYGDTNKSIYLFNGGGLEFYQTTVPVNKTIVCSNGANLTVEGGNAANFNIIAAPINIISGQLNINGNYNYGILISNVISGNGSVWVQWNSDVLFAGVNTFTGDFETQGRVRLVGNAVISSTNNVTINNGGSGVLTVRDNSVVNGGALRIWSGPATGALIVTNNGTINSRYIQVGNAFADWSGRTDATLTLQSGQTFRIDNGGRVKGNVIATSGSTVQPGGAGNIQNTGFLTNALTLQAGSTTIMEVSLNAGVTNTSDAINVVGALTYGGTLQINNIGTNALVAGTTFKMFSGGSYAGVFTGVSTNVGAQFVTWDLSKLPVNGTITVVSVTASSRPTLANSLSDGTLNLAWPSDHLGWTLQTNSVDVASPSQWFAYPGSASVTNLSLPIDPSKPHVFFRLSYP